MNGTSIKISLDTRRQKSDGTYPLIFRLTHNRKTTSLKTGISLKKEDWDEKGLVVKKSYKGTANVTRLNNEIQKKKAEALDKILKIEAKPSSIPLSLKDIKTEIDPETKSLSFYDFGDELVVDLIKAERIGTARSYRGVLFALKTYNKGNPLEKNQGGRFKNSNIVKYSSKFKDVTFKDLKFEEINYDFLKSFENYHLSSGNGLNGLAVYMRTIRSIFNQAIKAKKVEKLYYPFSDYQIKTQATKKRALDHNLFKRIISLKLPSTHTCFHSRNYFIASYLMYGMNFTDMAYLRKENIIDGRINYKRKKTGKVYDIKITEGLNEILNYYITLNSESKYVFPLIKRHSATEKQLDVLNAQKLLNENLKDIAKLCDIDQNLTGYVSRHSFATHAMMGNVPINAISAMPGHSSLKTTEIYLKSLPSNVLDDYNSQILNLDS
ncbi:site-specific integrase [Ferruginibacter sp. HRS2-29]|nr:site-specific integrase [Ferruginibacter sp. HRS2-29]